MWQFHNFASINIENSSNVENWRKKNIEDVHFLMLSANLNLTLVVMIVAVLVKVELHRELNDLSNYYKETQS